MEPASRPAVATLLLTLSGCSQPATPSTDSAPGDVAHDLGAVPDASSDTTTDASPDDTTPPPDTVATDVPAVDGATGGDPCPRLPAPGGTVVRVRPAQADDLPMIVARAAAGTTILLEDGTYRMTGSSEAARRMTFATPLITLRSASGDAAAVVLDGEYRTNEMVVVQASDVTIAEITLTHAIDHPIHVMGAAGQPDTLRTRLYGLRILDGGEQFVKVNPSGDRTSFVDDGRLECSHLELTDAGRPHIERTPGGCYTGGIDAHSARGWVVRHNRFVGIYCAGEGLAEHAVHFWVGSRDTLVENNTILDCARGVGFGLTETGTGRSYPDHPYPGVTYVDHYDGILRNNVIYAGIPYYDTGIELDQARGARVHHNTIVEAAGATGRFSSIDARFANTLVEVHDNLVRRLTLRNGATSMASANLENVPEGYFVDVAGRDFHLAPGASNAIDRGVPVPEAGLDLDGQPHTLGSAPDLGADELDR